MLFRSYGGKLTTYRSMAEEVVGKIASYFTPTKPWTKDARLPGGDLGGRTLDEFCSDVKERWPFLDEGHAERLVDAYGSRVDRVLGAAMKLEDLGPDLGHILTAAEVRYLMRHEWAETADDVLWRRTKLGLKFSKLQKEALVQFMAGVGAPAT